ncbi:MAG: coproporphyrinogen III oxidase family protein, partial [Planctomycetes bacterium]|nr:coproporphyrinogen III oxidase family protein [Planctomycetota bacterium]
MAASLCDLPSAADAVEPVEGNYFVATYPPFSTWRSDLAGELPGLLTGLRPADNGAAWGLYVHIPFCARRCQFCYYLSFSEQSLHQMDEYVDALLAELAIYRQLPAFAERRLGFVYFGGGTPSLLLTRNLRRLLAGLQSVFPWRDVEEVTFECAPRTATRGKLRALRHAGVNRVSLGVQQLNDDVLRLNGRIHRVVDVQRAYDAIQSVGFDEVNLDLIAGLVGQSEAGFRSSLERVLRMGPDSITVYQLEVPEYTPLYQAIGRRELRGNLPTWGEKRAMLAYAFKRMEEEGYALRSAYAAARNGPHRRFAYQVEQYQGADLVGIGASSFSYVGGVHYQNHSSLKEWISDVGGGRLPVARAYVLSPAERLRREFVLQLKLGSVDLARLNQKFRAKV